MSRVALVTGGATGIGLACASRLRRSGHRVAVTHLSSTPADLPDDTVAVRCDVRDEQAVGAAVAEVEDRLGPVEVLVSNAGATRERLLPRMSDADFTEVVDVSLLGGFHLARAVATSMARARWGRITFVSSMAAVLGVAGYTNYAAAKAGLVGLARSAARELAPRGVTVNVVAPGYVDTAMIRDLPREAYEAAVPLGRYGTAEEVAAVVDFLSSEGAGYTTGALVPVDGGLGVEGNLEHPPRTRRTAARGR